MAFGCWLLAIGYWLLAIGFWLLVKKRDRLNLLDGLFSLYAILFFFVNMQSLNLSRLTNLNQQVLDC